MVRASRFVALWLVLAILAIPALAASSLTNQGTMTMQCHCCCCRPSAHATNTAYHPAGSPQKAETRHCCCQAVPLRPAPATESQLPIAPAATVPVAATVAVDLVQMATRTNVPPEPFADTGLSSQAVLCTFLI